VTVSVGVATFDRQAGAHVSWLTETADRALYAAKVAGRNRMVAMLLTGRAPHAGPAAPVPSVQGA